MNTRPHFKARSSTSTPKPTALPDPNPISSKSISYLLEATEVVDTAECIVVASQSSKPPTTNSSNTPIATNNHVGSSLFTPRQIKEISNLFAAQDLLNFSNNIQRTPMSEAEENAGNKRKRTFSEAEESLATCPNKRTKISATTATAVDSSTSAVSSQTFKALPTPNLNESENQYKQRINLFFRPNGRESKPLLLAVTKNSMNAIRNHEGPIYFCHQIPVEISEAQLNKLNRENAAIIYTKDINIEHALRIMEKVKNIILSGQLKQKILSAINNSHVCVFSSERSPAESKLIQNATIRDELQKQYYARYPYKDPAKRNIVGEAAVSSSSMYRPPILPPFTPPIMHVPPPILRVNPNTIQGAANLTRTLNHTLPNHLKTHYAFARQVLGTVSSGKRKGDLVYFFKEKNVDQSSRLSGNAILINPKNINIAIQGNFVDGKIDGNATLIAVKMKKVVYKGKIKGDIEPIPHGFGTVYKLSTELVRPSSTGIFQDGKLLHGKKFEMENGREVSYLVQNSQKICPETDESSFP